MTPQQQLAFIKQKVIEAVPIIKDLVFGCQIMQYGHTIENSDVIYTIIQKHVHFYQVMKLERDDCNLYSFGENAGFNIIGRPIQLSDVLFAIEKHDVEIEMSLYGEIFHIGHYEKPNKEGYYSKCFWNLLLPLDGQKEETIAFLAELLV